MLSSLTTMHEAWGSLRNEEKANTVFLGIYALELLVIAVRTFFYGHILLVVFLGYPHFLMIALNSALLFSKKQALKQKLAELQWVHWVIFAIVVVELAYELMYTYDQMRDHVKHFGMMQKLLSNFLIICVFFPAFMNFLIMREVV